jgi:hypothetical protein
MSLHVSYDLDISQLPQECIDDCSAQGSVDEAVAYWRDKLSFTVDRDRTVSCLKGYGAWEDEELAASTDEELADRVLWLACGNFSEQQSWESDNPDKDPCDSDYGSSVFVLE